MGMHITRGVFSRPISLDQSKYMRDILAKHGMTDIANPRPCLWTQASYPVSPTWTHLHLQERRRTTTPSSLAASEGRLCLHASICFYGFEHPRLRPCASHGCSSPGPNAGVTLPSRQPRHTLDVGGGGADHSLQLKSFADAN
jgi:hypothetical protein